VNHKDVVLKDYATVKQYTGKLCILTHTWRQYNLEIALDLLQGAGELDLYNQYQGLSQDWEKGAGDWRFMKLKTLNFVFSQIIDK